MADTLRLTIEADNRQSSQAFAGVNQQLNNLDQLAARVAGNIAGHFTRMASQIQQAFQAIAAQVNSLNAQSQSIARSAMSGAAPPAPISGPAFSTPPLSIALSPRASAILEDSRAKWAEMQRAWARESQSTGMMREFNRQRGQQMWEDIVKNAKAFEQEASAANHATAAANTLASAHGKLGESAAFGYVKLFALYELMKKGADVVKSLTVDSALYAARTETLGVAMTAVGKANHIDPAALIQQEHNLIQANISRQNAREALSRLISAGMDVNKAGKLADMAKNLAVIAGTNSSDALTRLVYGIQSGQTDVLRTLGLNVNFEEAYRRKARALHITADAMTEAQKTEARLEAALAKAPSVAGVYDDAMETVGKRMGSLTRQFNDAKDAVGNQFLPVLTEVVKRLGQLAEMIAANPWMGVLLAGGGLSVGAAGVGALLAGAPGALAAGGGIASLGFFGSALYAGRKAENKLLDLVGVDSGEQKAAKAGFLASAMKMIRDRNAAASGRIQDQTDRAAEQAALIQQQTDQLLRESRKAAHDAISEAQTKGLEGRYQIIAEYKKREEQLLTKAMPDGTLKTFTDASISSDIRKARDIEIRNTQLKMERDLEQQISQEKANQLEGWDKIAALGDIEAAKLKQQGWDLGKIISLQHELTQEKGRTLAKQAEINAKEQAELAELDELQGYKRIAADVQRQIDKLQRDGLLNPETIDYYRRVEAARARNLDKQIADETDRKRDELAKAPLNNDLEGLQERRSSALGDLEGQSAYTLKQKLALEQRKYEIEVHYLDLITAKKAELRQLELSQELSDLKKKLEEGNLQQNQYDEQVSIARQKAEIEQNRIIEAGQAQRNDLYKKALHDQRTLIEEHNRSIYDSFKQSAGGVFDALITKAKSFSEAIADAFKLAFLTVLKEIVTSEMARSFTKLVTGQEVNQDRGLSGMIQGVRDMFSRRDTAMVPTVARQMSFPVGVPGQIGGGGLFSGADPNNPLILHAMSGGLMTAASGSYAPVPGMPGVYVDGQGRAVAAGNASVQDLPYNQTAQMLALTPLALPKRGLQGGFGGKYGGLLNGLLTMFGISMALGGLTQKGVGGTINRAGGAGMAAYGIAGKQLGILGSAGAGLAYDGIVRGGWAGMGEAAAGGALIGMRFGGPIPAAIGALAGFAAAGIRTLIGGDTPEEKMRKRIKALTGLDVTEKSILTQFVKAAGGTSQMQMDLWIRSKAGQDTLEMYAQQTGKRFKSMYNAQSFNMVQSGGSVYELPTYLNGSAMSPLSNLPGLGFSSASFDNITSAGSTNAGQMAVTLQIDGEATTKLMQGQAVSVIANNPRLVAASASQALSQGSSRRETGKTIYNPSEVINS